VKTSKITHLRQNIVIAELNKVFDRNKQLEHLLQQILGAMKIGSHFRPETIKALYEKWNVELNG